MKFASIRSLHHFGSAARAVTLALSMAVVACPTLAHAQGAAAAAEMLFQQGRDEMAKGNYESACGKLRQSDELDPALGTKLNLADCESKRGRLATAWELFKAVEQKLDPSDPRFAIAKQKREAIEPQVPKVVISLAPGAPPNTTVREGKAVMGSAVFGLALPLDPGEHQLLVTAPGRSEAKITVQLEPGKTSKVEVAPGAAVTVPQATQAPQAVGPAVGKPTMQAPPTPPQKSGGGRVLGYVFGGIGVAGLVVGSVAGMLTLDAKKTNDQHCNSANQTCDSTGRDAASAGRLYGALTTTGLAVGVVGVGLGSYFLLSNPKGSAAQTALVTQAGPTGTHLSLLHRW
jgi:hypothetical protein